jgi:MFS family permease
MGSVRRDKRRDYPDPAMGYDRDLDRKVRVRIRLISSSRRRCDIEIVHRFHNVWEFWMYNVVFGLFQAPYYAFAQTMMAELTPPGFDNMVRITVSLLWQIFVNLIGGKCKFFSLYGLSNTASSIIGPNVIQAIINKSGNNWDGFPFLFLLCTCASLVIWFAVDVPKGRRAAVRWAAEQRGTASGVEGSDGTDINAPVASSRESDARIPSYT